MVKKLLVLTFLALLLVTQFPSQSWALSENQKRVLQLGILYFNTEESTCSVDVDLNLSGNDNAEKIWNYLRGKVGLSPIATAALMGNFQAESHFEPRLNNGGDLSDYPLSPSRAYGIAQWLDYNPDSGSGRQTSLVKKAKAAGVIPGDLPIQLAFMRQELLGSFKSMVTDVINKPDEKIGDATQTVYDYYEGLRGSGQGSVSQRTGFAQELLKKFGASGGGAIDVAPSEGVCSGSVGPGQDTKYIDGFTIYSQYDRAWANKPYGTKTIAESGCGPSAMAMIITALTGTKVTPPITAAYADSRDQYEPGAGSKWSIAPVLASHWGLKSSAIGANMAKISATLQAGGLVITSGQGPLPFTSGGHYIVIRGVTADDKWKIGDSGHSDTSDKSWDPQQLLSNMNDGSVYAITK